MRFLMFGLVLAACGPPPDTSRQGATQNAAQEAYRASPAEENYRGCVRAEVAQRGTSNTPSMEVVQEALLACRALLREAAATELRRSPAFKSRTPPEDQVGAVMARKEATLARELNPNFPVT